MGKFNKLIDKILHSVSDSNIRFNDLCNLLKLFGFEERIKGDHHIFTMKDVKEILNLQPKGAKAKAYQVKQVRKIIIRYRLSTENKK